MVREDFIQSSTTVRVYETKFLTTQMLERIIDSKDFNDALKLLSETSYSKKLSTLKNPEEYGDALQSELIETYNTVKSMNKGEVIYKFVTLRYSFHNLKVLIKENILGTDFSDILSELGDVNVPQVRAELKSGKFSLDAEYMQFVKEVVEDYEEHKDPQRIDILLDIFYLSEFLKYAKESNVQLFEEYAVDLVDISNVKSLIRSKNQNKSIEFVKGILAKGGRIDIDQLLSVYGESIEEIIEKLMLSPISSSLKTGLESYKKTGRLQGIEKELENYLLEKVKETKRITYGPEVLFAYIQAKETEVKNLRIILVSKLNGLPPEDIYERLRDGYV